MTDIVELAFRANTQQLDQAERKLETLGRTADKTSDKTGSLAKAFDFFDNIGGPIGDVTGKIEGLGSQLGGAARALTAFATPFTAIATVAAGVAIGIEAVGFQMAALADEADETAQKLGISIQKLEELKLVAGENGGSVEGLTKVYDKLSKSLNKFDEDNEKTKYAFDSLGLSADDLANKSQEQIAGVVVRNWEDLGRSTKATAAVMQLLGPAFRDQIPSIKAVGENADETRERINKFGSAATPALIKAGGEQEKALTDLGLGWKGLANEVASLSNNMIVAAANWAANMLNSIRSVMKEWREGTAAMGASRAAMPQEQENALRRRAADKVYDGSNPNATRGDVEREFQRLRSAELNARFRASERGGYEETNVYFADQKRLAALKAKSDAAQPPSKGRKKGDGNKAERAAEKELRDLQRASDAWDDLFQKQIDGEQKLKGIDVEREQVRRRGNELLGEMNYLTSAQKDAMRADLLQQYDKKRALEDQKKTMEEQKKIDEDVLKLKLKQAETTDALTRRANEAIDKQRETFSNRFMSRADREDAERVRSVRSPFDAEISRIQFDLKSDPKMTGSQRTAAEDSLTSLRSKADAAVASMRQLNQEARIVESSWGEGVARGMNSYLDSIPSKAEQIAGAVNNVAKSMEDAFVNFAMTGKLSFKDLARSVLADIARMQAKAAVSGIMKLFGSAFGGGAYNGIGAMAANNIDMEAQGGAFSGGVKLFAKGDVFSSPTAFGLSGNRLGVMGEAGPEAVVPLKRGADGKLGVATTGGGKSFQQVVTIGDIIVQGGTTNEGTGAAVQAAMLKAMDGVAKRRIIQEQRPGGLFQPVS